MSEKCFCHLNGYAVKDAEARKRIEALEKRVVTPQMFGAVGDGVTDDTAAFNKAFNQTKEVYIPEGTYLFTGIVTVSNPIKITGAGVGKTVLRWAENSMTDTKLFALQNLSSLEIRDLSLDGGAQETMGYLACFIGSSNVTVSNVDVTGGYGYAFRINDTDNTYFENVTFRDITGGDGNPGGGIFGMDFQNAVFNNVNGYDIDDHVIYAAGVLNPCENIKIVNCHGYNTGRSGATAGAAFVLYADCRNVIIDGCTTKACRNGIDVKYYGDYILSSKNIKIANCVIDGSVNNGITVEALSECKADNIVVESCIITNAGQDGMVITHCNNSLINNCVINTVKRTGISFRYTSDSCITNCKVINAHDAYIVGERGYSCANIRVIDCEAIDNRETPLMDYGFYIKDCDYCEMHNCRSQNATGKNYGVGSARLIWTPKEEGQEIRSVFHSSAAPTATSVYCRAGDIAFNTNPTSGSPAGWICTETGYPGTWKGFGIIE